MRSSHTFLIFPVFATLFNLLIALLIIQHANGDLVPAQQESSLVELCATTQNNFDCDNSIVVAAADYDSRLHEIERKSSNLKKMPDYDFMAYVRRDVATFYQQEEGSKTETAPKFKGQAGKFVNMSPERLDLYWVSGKLPGHFITPIGPFESGGTASHPGHEFYFARHGMPSEPVCRFHVVSGTSVYYYDPFSEGEDPARCVTSEPPRQISSLSDDELALYDANVVNLDFGKAYKDFTGGNEWLSMYPKSPPTHHIWSADYINQEHRVQTSETHFTIAPPTEALERLSHDSMARELSEDVPFKEYRTEEPLMDVTLKVVSCEPRIFEIPHFLSDVEVDHLLDIASGKHLMRSTTGLRKGAEADVSETRTSTNSWVSRYTSPIVDAIYRRAADVLLLDEALLRHRLPEELPDLRSKISLAEDLQLVHYGVGEEYTAHHDFGYPTGRHPESPTRSINILLYLNEDMEGGETSFPRWRNGHTNGALDVKPAKGKAALFYMVGPDGNQDDLSQHAALPIRKGEKYMANLWIWDPIKF